MSQEAIEVTARDFADTVTSSRKDRELHPWKLGEAEAIQRRWGTR